MHSYRITRPDDPLLDPLWTIYRQSFPAIEQRALPDHLAALADPDFQCRALLENNTVRGLLCLWDLAGLRYVEHFALAPEARSGGRGSRVLTSLAAERPDQLLMLEIDPLVDDISRRRLGFYERLGYVMNPGVYLHPPYKPGDTAYPLLLLSLGRFITAAERQAFEREVLEKVLRTGAEPRI